MRLAFVLLFVFLANYAQAEGLPDGPPYLRIEAATHLAAIKRIAVDASGQLLATGSDDKTARLWNLKTGKLIRVFRPPIGLGNGGKVHAVALSPDGHFLAAGGWDAHAGQTGPGEHFIYLYDTTSGALTQRLGPLPDVVLDLAFSPDGKWLAAGLGSFGIRLWGGKSGFARPPWADAKYKANVYGVDFDRRGRLASVSFDGRVRLYQTMDAATPRARLLKVRRTPDGKRPIGVAFSPDGSSLAIVYLDSAAVSLLSTTSLKPSAVGSVDTRIVGGSSLYGVAWSGDGDTLYAGGNYQGGTGAIQIIAWGNGGIGAPRLLGGPIDSIMDLAGLPGGGVAWSAFDSEFGYFNASGESSLQIKPAMADLREKASGNFRNAADASAVWFGLGYGAADPWLFDLSRLSFHAAPERPEDFTEPNTDRLRIEGWYNSYQPKLNSRPLPLRNNEYSRSLAIAPDGASFVLGTDFSIYRYDDQGQPLWRSPAPGSVWGVNHSADGTIIMAALGDGTIRWYRTSDGAELLALFVHAPDKRWIVWTPTGYYAASPGGEDLIGWHINGMTWDDAVNFFPASRFRDRFYRPDIVQLVLETRDEAAAIVAANVIAKRKNDGALSIKDLPPVIEVIADAQGLEADETNLELRYRLRAPSGREVTKIEVRVDGQLSDVIAARGVSTVDDAVDGSVPLIVRIPSRDCEVSLVAFHGDQASTSAKVKVSWKGSEPPKPTRRLFALLVGVSKYDDPALELNFADKDAQDLAAVLKRQQGRFFQSVETTLLLNEEATGQAIDDALVKISAQAGPDDYTLVFMAGHGATVQNKFYFLPTSVDVSGDRMVATSLRGGVIASRLNAARGKVLFFIDACYSAQALRLDMSGFVNSITGENNAVMMYSSSSGTEVSYEGSQWQNGVFTEALMAILDDPASYNAQGEIITDELAVALRKKVNTLTDGRQTPIGRASEAVPPFPIAGL